MAIRFGRVLFVAFVMAALCPAVMGGQKVTHENTGRDETRPASIVTKKHPTHVARRVVSPLKMVSESIDDEMVVKPRPPNYGKQFTELACAADSSTISLDDCLTRYRNKILQKCYPLSTKIQIDSAQHNLKHLVKHYEAIEAECNEISPKCNFQDGGEEGLPLGPVASFFESYYSTNFGFHSGNILEHGVWSAKAMAWLFDTKHTYTTADDLTVAKDLAEKKELLTAIAFLHDLGKVGHPQEREFWVILHHFHYGYEMLTGTPFPKCFRSEDDNVRTHPSSRAAEDPSRWRVEPFEVDRCVARYGPDNCPTEDGKGRIFDIQTYLQTVLFPALKIHPKDYEETFKMIAILVGIHTGYGKVLQFGRSVDVFNHWLSNLNCLVQELGYNKGVLDLKMVYYAVLINAADVRGSVSIQHKMKHSSLAIPNVCLKATYPVGQRDDVNKLPVFHNQRVLADFDPHTWLMNFVEHLNKGVKIIDSQEILNRGLNRDILTSSGWTIDPSSDTPVSDDSSRAATVSQPSVQTGEPEPEPTVRITDEEEEDDVVLAPTQPARASHIPELGSEPELVSQPVIRQDTTSEDASRTALRTTGELEDDLEDELNADTLLTSNPTEPPASAVDPLHVEDRIGEQVIDSAVRQTAMDAQPLEPSPELGSSGSALNLDGFGSTASTPLAPFPFEAPVEPDLSRETGSPRRESPSAESSALDRFERESAQRRIDSSSSDTLDGLDLATSSNGRSRSRSKQAQLRRVNSFSDI